MRGFLAISLVLLSAAVLAVPPATQPQIKRGIATTNPEERTRIAMDRVIRQIEPSGKGDIARLDDYVAFFKREFIEDPRMFAFDVSATQRADGISVSGFVEFAEHATALAGFLHRLGFKTDHTKLETLPRADLLNAPAGLVSVDRAFVFDRVEKPRETVTECLRDEHVFLLDVSDGHYLVHCADGYVGYLPKDAVTPVDLKTLASRLTQFGNEPNRQTLDRVIANAESRLHAKYVWGGRSPDGLDCSGLVQTAFKSQGINLPRDADQQALVGTMTATRAVRDGMRRGDLLFFLSRTGLVRHVAIYLGDGTFLQSEDGGVKISSFDPKAPNYDGKHDKSFCFAKRVLE